MLNKTTYSEKNIEKLLNSSFNKEYQLDNQLKDDTLQLLEQKVAQNSKEPHPENKIVVALTAIWIAFAFLILSESRTSLYMLDLIKSAIGLSLVLIPVSSIVLIILRLKVYENKLV